MFFGPWVPCQHRLKRLRSAISGVFIPPCCRSRRPIFRLAIALVVAGISWASVGETIRGQIVRFGPVVRIVYLVPADRAVRDDYTRHLDSAIGHVQIWLRNELGEGLSFSTSKKPLEVIQTSHTASWYRENPAGDFAVWFFNNVVADGFALTGGSSLTHPTSGCSTSTAIRHAVN